MLLELINKFLMLLFCLSSLNIARQTFFFIRAILSSDEEEGTSKAYILDRYSLLILGLSISYVLTSLILGIKI